MKHLIVATLYMWFTYNISDIVWGFFSLRFDWQGLVVASGMFVISTIAFVSYWYGQQDEKRLKLWGLV